MSKYQKLNLIANIAWTSALIGVCSEFLILNGAGLILAFAGAAVGSIADQKRESLINSNNQ